jgi:hypothetical protein
MKLLRAFAWLLTVVAFMMPAATMQPARAMQGGERGMHCGDPMPLPCPDHDTVKHAAGTCCASMAAASALLPASGDALLSSMSSLDRASTAVAGLTGFSQAKEPPPPRS